MISKRGWTTACVATLVLSLACVPLRGGWDIEALLEQEPAIAALRGQRLGDLIPFPALDGDRIVLLACRFHEGQRVRVHGGGRRWPVRWAEVAVHAISRNVEGVELVLDAANEPVEREPADIEIVTIEAVDTAGPRGLGDTLSECDVSRTSEPEATFRGVLVRAEIRMRRARLDMTEQVREASAEEWVGALMHELAHALGFAGHAAAGDSILVRDTSRLRAAGRRALAGRTDPDRTLEALYGIPTGQRLGARPVNQNDLAWLQAIRRLHESRLHHGARLLGTFASVGDREARLVWRYSDESQFGIRMPHWRSELRGGIAISVLPDRVTRQSIATAVD